MKRLEKEISKEIYEEAINNHNMIPNNRRLEVFGPAACYGYGIYQPTVTERDGKYYTKYYRGDTCD